MIEQPQAPRVPLRVGLVGTGYAAKLRAEALQADDRAQLVAVAGYTLDRTTEFAQTYGAIAYEHWSDLVSRSDLNLDLLIVANVNQQHGAIVRAAIAAGLHVVVEYPLALDVAEATDLTQQAQERGILLHVEHIELLSGMHSAVKAALPTIGAPFYVRFTNLRAQRPAPQKWSYHPQLFGFPLVGAVSRIHRLTDLFGQVAIVNCHARYWPIDRDPEDYYTSCLCTAQLRFMNGVVADLVYGKGETIWQTERSWQIHGERGAIFINSEQGHLIIGDQRQTLNLGVRRGLFAKDTAIVLDYLAGSDPQPHPQPQSQPLYVTPVASLYALRVADALRQAAETGKSVSLV